MTKLPLTPKDLFLLEKDPAQRHRDLSESTEFRRVLQVALSQYAWTLGGGDDAPAKCWDAHNRLQGAKAFIVTLLTLADPPMPRNNQTTGRLEPEETE